MDTDLAARIRDDIINGHYDRDARLSEAQLCSAYGVSRTPVRLALRVLEREGMIRRLDGRGYEVSEITVGDISKAVEVRGHLESLAARLMAERENDELALATIADAVGRIDALIEGARLDDDIIRRMQSANADFHQTILTACGNEYVAFTCDRISHLPMLAPGSMVFDREMLASAETRAQAIFRLQIGNSQHKVIFEAIRNGQGSRAEAMMREHSRTMIDYIQMFEHRHSDLTVADLISFSAPSLSAAPSCDDTDDCQESAGSSAESHPETTQRARG